jgi:hypothetical protein
MDENKISYDRLVEKWAPVLNEGAAGKITDSHRRTVTAVVLENTEKALREERAQMGFLAEAPSAGTSVGNASVANWDPVLISLVRRSMPNMIAYDMCGVQPMTGPTGLIFAMKARYGKGQTASTEALFSEANTRHAGDSAAAQSADPAGLLGITAGADSNIDDERGSNPTFGGGVTTANAELSGIFRDMGFTIERSTVTARSRALKAEYSLELAQDLKAIHGLEAEAELANILTTEILAEINREVIRTINSQAKTGAQQPSLANRGIFDLKTDADGRWSAEKFKGLLVQLEREANVISKETRRGRGNFILCSSDVASALSVSGALDYAPALSTQLQVDDTGNTFAGVLNGRTRVYIDPFAVVDFITVGYKGSNAYDAGLFYCPYVPLTMVRAVGEDDFQPRIGFKTRYGMVTNPFVGATPANGLVAVRTNMYYRIFRVDNMLVS